MKRSIIMMTALAFTLALFMPPTSAKAFVPVPAAQDPTADEAAAYKAWFDANAAKDYPKGMELAKAYLSKFPSGKYADYLKKWISQVRGMMFQKVAGEKNLAEIIRIGKEVLAEDPDNLDYLMAMVVQIRTNELSANPPNFSHSADAVDFAQRATRLLEAGKSPTGADPKVFNKNVTLAYLQVTLAIIYEHDTNIDKALAAYEKAAELDPTNATFFFHCGRIHNDKYDAAAKKYQAVPEADRDAAEPKPEVKAALDEVNKQADAVINCWARFLGMTADKKDFSAETRGKIEDALKKFYKYRHPDSADGWQKLVDQYKTKP